MKVRVGGGPLPPFASALSDGAAVKYWNWSAAVESWQRRKTSEDERDRRCYDAVDGTGT